MTIIESLIKNEAGAGAQGSHADSVFLSRIFFISFLQQISIFSLYSENKTLGATEEVVDE